jgi:class 3 adenylate cyclase
LCQEATAVGTNVRFGVHIGEVQLMDDEIGGLSVHIGSRVMDLAGAGEVLVSSTVKDIMAGGGIRFEDRGMHALKGVPDEWHLFRASDG